mgnify:CR=1 FL=1
MALSAAAGACRITREYLPEGTASVDELEVVRKKVRRILEPMVDAFPIQASGACVGTSKTFRSLARLAGAVLRQSGREDT